MAQRAARAERAARAKSILPNYWDKAGWRDAKREPGPPQKEGSCVLYIDLNMFLRYAQNKPNHSKTTSGHLGCKEGGMGAKRKLMFSFLLPSVTVPGKYSLHPLGFFYSGLPDPTGGADF